MKIGNRYISRSTRERANNVNLCGHTRAGCVLEDTMGEVSSVITVWLNCLKFLESEWKHRSALQHPLEWTSRYCLLTRILQMPVYFIVQSKCTKHAEWWQISPAILHIFLGVQVATMLSITGFNGRSLVAQAAFSGDKATFEAVTTALVTRLRSDQVRYRLYSLPISMVKIFELFSYAGPWTHFLSRGHYAF